MSLCFRILTLVACMSIVCQTFGAQPRITKSNLSSQLQQPTVSAIRRDTRGILWIGTQQGLHRFDGVNLTVFNSDDGNTNSIPNSEIKDIAEDKDGNILVATSAGFLLKFNPQTETFDTVKQFENAGLIRLLVSRQGDIWLLCRNGLVLFDPRFQNTADWVSNLNLFDSIGSLHDVFEDTSGTLWVGGSLGLAKVIPGKKSFVLFDLTSLQLPKNCSVTALDMNNEGHLIIGTDIGQLMVWNAGTGKPIATSTVGGSAAHYITEFVQYGDMLIVATDRGLFATDNYLSFIQNLDDKGVGLSNHDIYSLFRDGKYIWIGTIDGLNILSFTPFELFNKINSDVYNDILAFDEDIDGHIWLGTYSGLYRYDEANRTHAIFKLASSASGDKRISAIAARENELWLGLLQGGVHVMNINSGDSQNRILTSNNRIAIEKILAPKDSRDVWIASYDDGLFRITASETHSYYNSGSLPEKRITSLFRSTTSILLAVSENKVYQHDPKTDHFNELRFEFGLGEKRPVIYSLAQAYNDDILIGTKDHGLFIWDRESQIENLLQLQRAEDSGVSTSTIYGIEPDSEGNLWCSTQNGIVKLDSRSRLIKRFTTADGLQGNDFTLGASFTSRAGLIYFGGVNGYNRFNPTEVSIDNAASPMRLTNISLPLIDDREIGPVNELKSLELTHRDHFVTFQFSVLDFIYPEKNQFRYKLENFDSDWVDSGTRSTATYTNLPPGDYVFRVQGANSAGIWNRNGITLDVHVLSAPWLTWWAFLIYGMALLFLNWSARRIYHSYTADQKSAQMQRDQFEAESKSHDDLQEQLELQDELVKSAYQHNLTTLSLVRDCISYRSINESGEVRPAVAESSVKRIAALSGLEDCLFYQAGVLVANLHKYTDCIMPALLKSSSVKPETIVTINEVSSILLPAELASPLSIVIYELLENCMQHAFELESPANYIFIRMVPVETQEPATRYVDLSVRDSGVGFSDSIEDLARNKSGITIVQVIVEKLGGTIQFSGAKGTTVSMKIPYPDNS